jgi:S1-C subfamily serine protease
VPEQSPEPLTVASRIAPVGAKQAIARMRSSIVSINESDPMQPIGSGVIVRGRTDDGIVATALHVVQDVAPDDLQIGFPVPPSEQGRGSVTMLGATVIATDERNDLALLEMEHNTFVTHGVPHPGGGRYPATVAELEAERPEDGEDVMISG